MLKSIACFPSKISEDVDTKISFHSCLDLYLYLIIIMEWIIIKPTYEWFQCQSQFHSRSCCSQLGISFKGWPLISFIGYMELVTEAAVAGMHVPMSTPEFNGSIRHCLLFDYDVMSADRPLSAHKHSFLGVYLRTSSFVYTGRRLWFTNNTGKNHVHIQIWPASTVITFIDFVGTIADPNSTVIQIANVKLQKGLCSPTGNTVCKSNEFQCRNGRGCIPESLACDGIIDCMDESDELLPECGRQAHSYLKYLIILYLLILRLSHESVECKISVIFSHGNCRFDSFGLSQTAYKSCCQSVRQEWRRVWY